jgi:hypothetical protein
MKFEERLSAARGGLIRLKSPVYIHRAGWSRENEHICVLIDPKTRVSETVDGWTAAVGEGGRRYMITVLLMGSLRVIWVCEKEVEFLTGSFRRD